MTLENIEFIFTNLISILDLKNRDGEHEPLRSSTMLHDTCFLGLKIMLTNYPTSFEKYWRQTKKTILDYMEENPGRGIFMRYFVSFFWSVFISYLLFLFSNSGSYQTRAIAAGHQKEGTKFWLSVGYLRFLLTKSRRFRHRIDTSVVKFYQES